VGRRFVALAALQLLEGDRLPELVDDLRRISPDRVGRAPKMLAPEAQPGPAGECRIAADDVAGGMAAGVEAVATERGKVDAADEGDLAVDDHQLLVVAVHRPLARVERPPHLRPPRQFVTNAAHLRAPRRRPQRWSSATLLPPSTTREWPVI
jgi:hypothetical protein